MKARKKAGTVKTSLTKIDGIGEKKAELLLRHFKSVQRISMASVEDILKVKGIGEKDANKIYNYFKESNK